MLQLRRKVSGELFAWADSDEKKCLLLRGARQVGKTYVADYLGSKRFSRYIRVNFLESPGLKAVFSGNLDINTLLLNFSLYMPGAEFVPGETLLLLDEIQECPEAVTSLKFWAQDGRFKVIATGSMLGIDYKRPSSYPVGSIRYVDMWALDFEEFLWAAGIPEAAIEILRGHFETCSEVPEALHVRIFQLLRAYAAIGGMPEAVTAFFEANSAAAADKKQREILNGYRYDIAHYASPKIKLKAEKCYFSIPDQLAKDNHKFQYSIVEKGSAARKFGTSLDWLRGACLTIPCWNVKNIEFPLSARTDSTNFRLYPSDIGLLSGMHEYALKARLMQEEKGSSWQAKGGIYEALTADLLSKNKNRELYFRKNEQSTFEIEFLLTKEDGIIPVEVKAGRSRSRSLDNLLERREIPYGYKLVYGNAGRVGKKITLPIYMAMFL